MCNRTIATHASVEKGGLRRSSPCILPAVLTLALMTPFLTGRPVSAFQDDVGQPIRRARPIWRPIRHRPISGIVHPLPAPPEEVTAAPEVAPPAPTSHQGERKHPRRHKRSGSRYRSGSGIRLSARWHRSQSRHRRSHQRRHWRRRRHGALTVQEPSSTPGREVETQTPDPQPPSGGSSSSGSDSPLSLLVVPASIFVLGLILWRGRRHARRCWARGVPSLGHPTIIRATQGDMADLAIWLCPRRDSSGQTTIVLKRASPHVKEVR
jgi:hypothetical protein